MSAQTEQLLLAGVALAAAWDVRSGRIPDRLTAAVAVSAFAAAGRDGHAASALAGAAAAGAALGLLFVVTAGNGIGLGDVKLGLGIGAGLGATSGITALALAFVSGAIYALALLCGGRARRGDAIRFGPFLALGTGGAILADALLQ